MKPVIYAEGERIRIRHAVERMRNMLAGLEAGLNLPGPLNNSTGQSLVECANTIAMHIASHDTLTHLEMHHGREEEGPG